LLNQSLANSIPLFFEINEERLSKKERGEKRKEKRKLKKKRKRERKIEKNWMIFHARLSKQCQKYGFSIHTLNLK